VLTTNAVRVIDLFREWDEDGDGIVSKKEFRRAMPLLGLQVGIRVRLRVRVRVAQGPSPSFALQVPAHEVDALFDSWDPDGSGELDLNELNKVQWRGGDP